MFECYWCSGKESVSTRSNINVTLDQQRNMVTMPLLHSPGLLGNVFQTFCLDVYESSF